ncbi:MAG: DNA photolyase family protein [Akkermansiaceae bacterium]|nr:DNA photolyase family protein [Akkermansiaceae bacterium]
MTAPASTTRSISVPPTGIVWFRKDLRLADHLPLLEGSRNCARLCPVFVTSTWSGSHDWTGSNRQQFLCGSLASLDRSLRGIGGSLVIRRGPPAVAIERLILESGAGELYFQRDSDPHARAAERAVESVCARLGVRVRAYHDATLQPPEAVLTDEGKCFRVFTPFWRKWAEQPVAPVVPAVAAIRLPDGIHSDPLPTIATWGLAPSGAKLLPAGEGTARERLRAALEKMADYGTNRDSLAMEGTSRLSQDLRFGLLSARTVVTAAREAMAAADPRQQAGFAAFIRQVAWRDFYYAILHHVPETLTNGFAPQWRGLPWDGTDESLAAWQHGRTGFPLVDAGMRELLASGHMHNRTRMITAMFLTKDLRHHWAAGESWFMRHLTDGDTAPNNGGWQWCAGTGADAAPYFRIQNPWLQSARHDPQGTYIKRWLPELARVEPSRLHQPPPDGRPLADGYPLPIVDHHAERTRTLAMFKRHQAER